MRTFIANFGQANYLWPACREQATVATFEDKDLRPFWEKGDREGYINYAIAHKKSAAGITPTRPVASRWFNVATIVSETVGDVWIHRGKDELWWTVTKPNPVRTTIEPSYDAGRMGPDVYVMHKPAQVWSNKNKRGGRLVWQALHPRAREFLFLEGTVQQLSENNAVYAHALIDGDDLSAWHSRSDWRAKEAKSGKAPVTVYSAAKRAAFRMTKTAMETTARANGQEVLRTIKNKEVRFESEMAMQDYIEALLISQEYLCAITSFPLQFDGEHTDDQMLCSLDRIDSNGHYEAGNLQVVCRFVNRWKSDTGDAEFRRLVRLLQTSAMPV